MIFCRDILRERRHEWRRERNEIESSMHERYGTDNNRDVTVGRHGVVETNTRVSKDSAGIWIGDSIAVMYRVESRGNTRSRVCDNLGAVDTPMTDIIATSYAYGLHSLRKIISGSVRFIIMRATHIRLICETTLDASKIKKSGGNFYYQLAIWNR